MAELPSAFQPFVTRDGLITQPWFRYLSEFGTIGVTLEPPINIAQDNTNNALTLTTPDSTDPMWDGQPLAALKIDGPPTPTTRAFLCGLWVITNGGSIDKGRGIIISNIGQSDGLYIQCDGINGTGEAIYLTPAATTATGLVISTTLASQTGLVLRQETPIIPTAEGILLSMLANGAVTEMAQVGSTLAGQVGFVFRMFGANSLPVAIVDAIGTQLFLLTGTGEFYTASTGDNFIEGIVKHGATSIAANNAQVVTRGNVGPGGAGLSIQEWLVVKNAAGATRYIEMYG